MKKQPKKTKLATAVDKAYKIDPGVKAFATAKQAAIIDAVIEHGSLRAASRALDIGYSSVYQSVAAVQIKASREGFAPGHFVNGVAPGNVMGKVTVQRGPSGDVERTWERQSPEGRAAIEAMKEFAASLADDIKPLPPSKGPTTRADDDLMCVIPMGDPHFGMYSWWKDSGSNFDLDIARDLTMAAIDDLVASAPNAAVALLLNLGDMFHADNQKNVTNSGHQLDVDGRWKKVLMVGLECMVYCIRRMLEKFPKVIFRINGGNHDGHSSYALAIMLSCWFREEKRVEIDTTPGEFWYHEFGRNLFGSTHGDKVKGDKLMGVMAADQAEAWGRTEHRMWFVGHVHHEDRKEYPGGVVEYFRTLAARDAWHAGQGYRAGRDMCLLVFDRTDGLVTRNRCDYKRLRKAA